MIHLQIDKHISKNLEILETFLSKMLLLNMTFVFL